MRKLFYLLLLPLFLFSCKNELVEKVEKSYATGKPEKVVYYNSSTTDTASAVKEIQYYPDGKKRAEGALANGKRQGLWIYWHPNGTKWSEGNFENGKSQGEFNIWSDKGISTYKAFYKNGKPDGRWLFYDFYGKANKEVVFENGKKVSEKEL